jgi:tetratricopeptide (TPR) repeat protein
VAEAKKAEGRLSEVPDSLKRIIELLPEETDTRLELAKVYLELGDIVRASDTYQEVISMALERKEFGLAQRAASRLLKAIPHSLVAHRALAELYEHVGEDEKRLTELRTVGWLSYCGGQYEEAAAAFEEVLRLRPSLTDIALVLPSTYELLGDKRKAFDQYLLLAKECAGRNDLSLARWAGEKATQIDGASNKVERVLAQVDEKEMMLKRGSRGPVIERPGHKPPQPVIDKKEKSSE